MPLISKNDCFADRSILALQSAYQECPVTFKLMTSQVVQRARPSRGRIWQLRCQRVNIKLTNKQIPKGRRLRRHLLQEHVPAA